MNEKLDSKETVSLRWCGGETLKADMKQLDTKGQISKEKRYRS